MNAYSLKLHLGCGDKHIPGFVHIDVMEHPHVDHFADIRDLSFIDSDSVDLIFASHVLEHFGRHEVKSVLTEWFRVLKHDGILRLAVPDFEACARLYLEQRLDGGLTDILGLLVGGQKNAYDYHQVVFDESYLSQMLSGVGFKAVRRWDWRETEHADFDDYSQAYLPHMDKTGGTLMSLNLEAVK